MPFHPTNIPIFIKKIKREIRWRQLIALRAIQENLAFLNPPASKNTVPPQIVYMTGMPRTGSSLMKNYLGEYSGLKVEPFEPKGFYISWHKSTYSNEILIDKSTHYIRALKRILRAVGCYAYICCIVRDPRDQLASLFEFKRHPELPRTDKFWDKWYKQYSNFFSTAENNLNVNFFFFKYEDLVRHPVQVKLRFLTWLGFKVDRSKLTSNYKIAHLDDIQDDNVVTMKKISSRSLDRHKKITDPQLLSIINGYEDKPQIYAFMNKLGYTNSSIGSINISFTRNVSIFKPEQGKE